MKTIVSESLKKALIERPDFPEFERKMKAVWGDDWELITYSEVKERNCKGTKMDAEVEG